MRFNEDLLRSKMALAGDYDAVILADICGISIAALHQRRIGRVEWKQSEIQKIADRYNLTNEEIIQIFKLRGEPNDR